MYSDDFLVQKSLFWLCLLFLVFVYFVQVLTSITVHIWFHTHTRPEKLQEKDTLNETYIEDLPSQYPQHI